MHPEIAIIPAHDRVAFTKVSVAYLPAFPISIKRNESVEELDSETIKFYRRNKRAQAGQIESHRLANLINDFKTARFYGASEPSRLPRLSYGCGDHHVANAVPVRLGRRS